MKQNRLIKEVLAAHEFTVQPLISISSKEILTKSRWIRWLLPLVNSFHQNLNPSNPPQKFKILYQVLVVSKYLETQIHHSSSIRRGKLLLYLPQTAYLEDQLSTMTRIKKRTTTRGEALNLILSKTARGITLKLIYNHSLTRSTINSSSSKTSRIMKRMLGLFSMTCNAWISSLTNRTLRYIRVQLTRNWTKWIQRWMKSNLKSSKTRCRLSNSRKRQMNLLL